MRLVLWFVLLFVVAVVCATSLGANEGLVSFFWQTHRVDMSLNLFLLVILELCVVLVLIMQGVRSLVGLPQRARQWRAERRDRQAQTSLRKAFSNFFSGRFSRSEKLAKQALTTQSESEVLSEDKEFTALAFLIAAASAHRLQDKANRNAQLAQALAIEPNSATQAVIEGARLMAAEWALDDRDAPRALELLAELPPGVARRTHTLRLRLQASRLGLQPHEALKTARLLIKHQGLSVIAAAGLTRSLAFEVLDSARDIDQLQTVWHQFDATERRDPFVASKAALLLAHFGAAPAACLWLRPFWERLSELSTDERTALSQSLVAAMEGVSAEWLPCLETASLQFEREPAIAHAVGTAYAKMQLWGKARQLLTHAAQHDALEAPQRRQAWLTLARIAEHDDQLHRAVECYREAALILG